MRKVKYYDENYCIGLIKAALSPNGKNDAVNKCALKDHILKRVAKIKDQYCVAHEDLLSEICFNFLRKSVIRKIDNQKGSPATFILHYVFNELRNIERSCARGTFDKAHKHCDAMDKVAFHLEDLDANSNWTVSSAWADLNGAVFRDHRAIQKRLLQAAISSAASS